jgi:hypothetical protein
MKDNFDLYNWKQGKNPTDSSKGEFDLYEWNKKRYLNELELDQEDDNINQDDESGSVNIDRGGDDARMGAEEESDSNVVGEAEEKEYEVGYWIQRNDDYDDDYVKVMAKSEEEAIEKAKSEERRGKDFKIIKR